MLCLAVAFAPILGQSQEVTSDSTERAGFTFTAPHTPQRSDTPYVHKEDIPIDQMIEPNPKILAAVKKYIESTADPELRPALFDARYFIAGLITHVFDFMKVFFRKVNTEAPEIGAVAVMAPFIGAYLGAYMIDVASGNWLMSAAGVLLANPITPILEFAILGSYITVKRMFIIDPEKSRPEMRRHMANAFAELISTEYGKKEARQILKRIHWYVYESTEGQQFVLAVKRQKKRNWLFRKVQLPDDLPVVTVQDLKDIINDEKLIFKKYKSENTWHDFKARLLSLIASDDDMRQKLEQLIQEKDADLSPYFNRTLAQLDVITKDSMSLLDKTGYTFMELLDIYPFVGFLDTDHFQWKAPPLLKLMYPWISEHHKLRTVTRKAMRLQLDLHKALRTNKVEKAEELEVKAVEAISEIKRLMALTYQIRTAEKAKLAGSCRNVLKRNGI